MGRTGRGPFPLPAAGDTDSRTPYQSTYNLLMTMSVKSPKGRCAPCVVRGRPCYTLPADVDGPRSCTECFRHGRDCCFDDETTATTDEQVTVDQEVAVDEGSSPSSAASAESSVASSPEPEPQHQAQSPPQPPRQLPWLATPPAHMMSATDLHYPVQVQPASTLNDQQRAVLQFAVLQTAQRRAAAEALTRGTPSPPPAVSPRRRRHRGAAESEAEPQRRMYHPLFGPGSAPSPVSYTAATIPARPGQSTGGYEGVQSWPWAHMVGAPLPTTPAVGANATPQMYTPQMYTPQMYYVVADTAPHDPAEQHRARRRRHDTGVTVGTLADSGEAPSASQQTGTSNVDLSRLGNHDFANPAFQRGVFGFEAPGSSSSAQLSATASWRPSPSSRGSGSAASSSSTSTVIPPDWNMDDLPPAATTRVWYTSTHRPRDGSGSPTPDEDT